MRVRPVVARSCIVGGVGRSSIGDVQGLPLAQWVACGGAAPRLSAAIRINCNACGKCAIMQAQLNMPCVAPLPFHAEPRVLCGAMRRLTAR